MLLHPLPCALLPSKVSRILLADDHPVVQENLRSRLAAPASVWECAPRPRPGWTRSPRRSPLAPEIVVMDYKLPDLDGLAGAAEIRKRAPRIEVLLFSETGSHFILQRIFHSKVRGCLLKSEALEELIPALETVRRHHRFRSRALTELCEAIAESAVATEPLTRREIEVLRLIAEANSTKEIASRLGLSNKTIESHRTNLFAKIGCHCVAELVCYAIYHGIVEVREPVPSERFSLPPSPEAGKTSSK